MRCALIEYNPYHEEVLPTFVRLLNELDVKPDVYTVRNSRGRLPFERAAELRMRRRKVENMDRWFGLRFRRRKYDLLIVNSMEPASIPERLSRLATPVLGVMHNTELLADDATYRAFFARPRRLPLVLGRHIAAHFARDGQPMGWISHVYFGQPEPARTDGPTTFAVCGNVEFHRRNYDALLTAASELVAGGMPFRISIIGRSADADGLTLRREIEARGLVSAFEFTPGEIPHPAFFDLLAGADFVLPLIDRSTERLRPYFETKVASSIPFAIGLGVPLVLHRDLAAVYDVGSCGLTHEEGELAGAMRRAIESGAEERTRWRSGIDAARSAILAASRENLRAAMSAVAR
jgi:hypothetical protein